MTKEVRIYSGEKSVFFHNWCWKDWTVACNRIKLDHSLTSCRKINTKWIKGLNLRFETTKLLAENWGSIFFHISLSNICVLICLLKQKKQRKANINKWEYIKLKTLYTVKETINKMKGPPIEWEKIFANNISDKVLIYKGLIQLNIKRTNKLIYKWTEDLNRHFSKNTHRWLRGIWKDAQHH